MLDARALLRVKEDEISKLLEEMAVFVLERQLEETNTTIEANRGKTIEDVSARHARRKMATFKSFAAKALWFSESFGLVPEYITLHKAKSGSLVRVPLGEIQQSCSVDTTETNRDKVCQVLYILDRFAVSDEAYHELRMSSKEEGNGSTTLPPLHILKRTRREMNSEMEIVRLLGAYPGAFRPLLDLLKKSNFLKR